MLVIVPTAMVELLEALWGAKMSFFGPAGDLPSCQDVSNIFFLKGMIQAKFMLLVILAITFSVARGKYLHRFLCT